MTELLSIDTVAERCQVDVPTVLRWIRDGDIPAPCIVGGLARWTSGGFDTWAASGCPKCDPPGYCDFERVRLAYSEDAWIRVVELADKIGADRAEEILIELETEN
ncbi:MAG: hypothetical protein KJ000_24995 [Pirellulaceae bacterium]|nr:hypothetical protein [Pirellulaceae bacterium]